LGIGAMTDFSALLSNPRLILIGAAAQIGDFWCVCHCFGFGFLAPMKPVQLVLLVVPMVPTAIFLSSKLAPELMGAIAISAYSYMALVPVIQPPIMRLLTNRKERVIRMKPPRTVSKLEKILFPICRVFANLLFGSQWFTFLGMLFFGNLLKESTVTKRLADTAKGPMIDIVTIFWD
jgi:carboxybiotin decarboxylase